jgi:hypothetical protein
MDEANVSSVAISVNPGSDYSADARIREAKGGTLIRALVVLMLLVAAQGIPADFAQNVTPHYYYHRGSVLRSVERPTDEQIEQWWLAGRKESADKWKENEKVEIARAKPVVLEGGEQAFLCLLNFYDRPYNFRTAVVLARPHLKAAQEIKGLWRKFAVYDVDNDGVSEIVIEGSVTAHGSTEGTKSILRFDGWKPIVLHEQEFGDYLGYCGEEDTGWKCHSKEVYWQFTDLNGDGMTDLVELVIYREGPERDQLKWRTEVHAYLLKGKKFIEVTPDLKLVEDLDSK